MAVSSLLSVPHFSLLNSTGGQSHCRSTGAAVRSNSWAVVARGESICGTLVARGESSLGGGVTVSSRFSDFSGLSKMSTSEGITKRVRDPKLAANEAKATASKSRNYVSAQMSKPGVKSLVIAVGIPLLLGSVNALFNSPFSKWFSDLKKPWWEPPGPIFGGAWSILYPLMGLASWLVWAEGGFHKQTGPLALYVTQLFLNLLWPMLFFGSKKLGLALFEIILLDGVLAATINAFQPVNHVAANLLKPYLAWVLFATALNFNLWLNNKGGAAQPAQ